MSETLELVQATTRFEGKGTSVEMVFCCWCLCVADVSCDGSGCLLSRLRGRGVNERGVCVSLMMDYG